MAIPKEYFKVDLQYNTELLSGEELGKDHVVSKQS
jgi:hypothetical protein